GATDISLGKLFGFPYVSTRKPAPFDTVLLNYNWQIWDTQAFSLYAGTTETIDKTSAQQAIDGVLRFMSKLGMTIGQDISDGLDTLIVDEDLCQVVQSPHAGILVDVAEAGQTVRKGQSIARIMHPYDGTQVSEIFSPCDGMIFFARNKSITYQNTILFRINPN
ncbi:MAG: succinylglutamate desuccinylase/aspartoacylase family protein, partial [Bacteroidales bacterium]|nr:succinylglutamate desuccinylase/aspartoacylase family protein [Candidatus Liminaster caballi]